MYSSFQPSYDKHGYVESASSGPVSPGRGSLAVGSTSCFDQFGPDLGFAV
jgi:hypothetical protein